MLLTQPKYILLLYLISIERSIFKGSTASRVIYNTNRQLSRYSRDILDKSDKILSIRLKLTYAIGEQQYIDFVPERQIIAQEIISLVQTTTVETSYRYPNGVLLTYADTIDILRVRILSSEAAYDIIDYVVELIVDNGFPGLPKQKVDACPRVDILSFLRSSRLSVNQ